MGLAGLLVGAIGFGQPLEDMLRAARNTLHEDKASGDIVLVAIDERSLRELHNWPWPRRYHARMVDELNRLGAKRIFFDVVFSSPSAPSEDRAFAEAMGRSRAPVTLAMHPAAHDAAGGKVDLVPLQVFRRHADLATVAVSFNHQNAVWRLPLASQSGTWTHPSFASSLADRGGAASAYFPVDYSIDPASIPSVSAADVVSGRVPQGALLGKDVLIGTTSRILGDTFLVPGRGQMGGVYVHALGAETLKRDVPVSLGWLPAFLVAMLAAAGAFRMRSLASAFGLLGMASILILFASVFLEAWLIFVDTVPALFVLLIAIASLAWSRVRKKATLNAISGLPNLNALRQVGLLHDRPLIAGRVRNYSEIASALSAEGETALLEQIVARLTVGGSGQKVFHGDDGLFVWFLDEGGAEQISAHLDALSALFRSSLNAGDAQIDLNISFGVDIDGQRTVANRLGSALVAADEAAREGRKWKVYDPAKLKDATWKLSVLSQLDAAVDAQELWVALQPKLDLTSGLLCGAEVLVRWTHPTKGLLPPSEFIPAAEASGRIDKVTDFVLREGIGFAAAMRRRGVVLPVAINLSARSLDRPGLTSQVSGLLSANGLPAELLTLEITETAALSSDVNLQSLEDLRSSGVRISIDDYGTGQSTLEYLKKIPACEIKIDQSFVRAIKRSRSDCLLVHSTIQLAHSLGQVVVAEGVEDEDTLAALREMGCDMAQGFFIGRPMRGPSLARRLLSQRKQAA